MPSQSETESTKNVINFQEFAWCTAYRAPYNPSKTADNSSISYFICSDRHHKFPNTGNRQLAFEPLKPFYERSSNIVHFSFLSPVLRQYIIRDLVFGFRETVYKLNKRLADLWFPIYFKNIRPKKRLLQEQFRYLKKIAARSQRGSAIPPECRALFCLQYRLAGHHFLQVFRHLQAFR